jgi:conserved domain
MDNVFEIKEEQIDIIKNIISHGKVAVYKESYVKDETFTLPVQNEDLVIEHETGGKPEVLRLPISTEVYDHKKEKVVLNDIDVFKSVLTETKHIPIVLKKEEVHDTR